MTDPNHNALLTPAGDARAIRHLAQAIASGRHWYTALLEAIGLWETAEETHNGRAYRYLIAGEAFDRLVSCAHVITLTGKSYRALLRPDKDLEKEAVTV